MRILSLKLTNFRSIGDPGIEIIPETNLNTLIGANNVGKSSIFLALAMMAAGRGFTEKDWHWGLPGRQPNLDLTISLDPEEINEVFAKLIPETEDVNSHPDGATKFRNWLASSEFKLTSRGEGFLGGGYKIVRRELFLRPDGGERLGHPGLLRLLEEIEFSDIGDEFGVIQFPSDLDSILLNLIPQVYKSFSDVRARPSGIGGERGSQVLESYDGGSTIDLLMNIKTGTHEQRGTYKLIQRRFREFFPGWTFEAVGQQGRAPEIVFNRDGHNIDINQEAVGTGVVEVLTLVANLEGKTDSVLVLEEPELHLHPQSQRALQHMIVESSERNQIFVLTHSPYFIDANYLPGLSRMWMPGDSARLTSFPKNLKTKELATLRESFRELRQREVLSSSATLLVEGQTEEAFLQAIGPRMGLDTDAYGVTILSVKGEGGYIPYIRLLESMEIPYLCHRDQQKGTPRKYKAKFRIIGAEFEEYFDQQGLGEIYKEAEAAVEPGNKVKVGRHLGIHMDPDKVPEKFKEILQEIISIANGEREQMEGEQ